MSADSEERIAIVLTPAGPLIGALKDLEDRYELRRPRGFQITNAGGGMAKIEFVELLGKPETFVFTGDVTYSIPTDQNVIKGYLESWSRIKIASALPPSPRVN